MQRRGKETTSSAEETASLQSRKANCASSSSGSVLAGMAEDGVKHPLLRESPDVRPITDQQVDPNRRRLRRCKSAPLAKYSHEKVNQRDGSASLPPFKTTFGTFHLRKVVVLLFLYLATGTICFYIVRNQIEGKKTNGVLDSVYFCIVTMTSVGYGDLVPNSAATKVLLCLFVFSGMALVGLILTKTAIYLVEKQELLLIKALYMSRKFGPAETLKYVETSRARNKCILEFVVLLVLIVVGTGFLATVEKLDVVDAFYCVCSTISSLGYGDNSFSTTTGRLFAMFWILTSTLCLAKFFFIVAELNTENRQKELVKWVLTKRTRNGDLEAADPDDDFIIRVCPSSTKRWDRSTKEDISVAMEGYFDQSRTLSASDLRLAQSSKTAR